MADEIKDIIKYLMDEKGLNEAELARLSKLPQATLNRVLTGGTKYPRVDSLKAIADSLDVNISLFCDAIPLAAEVDSKAFSSHKRTNYVYLIEWHEVHLWPIGVETTSKNQIYTDSKDTTELSFALRVKDGTSILLRSGSLLIVSPSRKPRHGSLVVVCNDKKSSYLRQVVMDGGEIYLSSINPLFEKNPPELLDDSLKIAGVVCQIKMDL